MNKLTLTSILLFAAGIMCFAFAFYAFQSWKNLLEVFDYYSISESVYKSNPNIAQTIFDLKYGIIKFTALGTISCITGIILAFVEYKKGLDKN